MGPRSALLSSDKDFYPPVCGIGPAGSGTHFLYGLRSPDAFQVVNAGNGQSQTCSCVGTWF